MSFDKTKEIKESRKERRCECCLEKITIGSPAVNCVGTFDGFYNYYLHPLCHQIINRLYSLRYIEYDDGFEPGFLKNDLHQSNCNTPEEYYKFLGECKPYAY